MVEFLHANPQLKRVGLFLTSTTSRALILTIKQMSCTTFSLIWYHALDISALRGAQNVDFFILSTPENLDVDVVSSLANLEYFGVQDLEWSPGHALDPLRRLSKLRTFALRRCKIDPPLHLSWTRHCATLREVVVHDHNDLVWCDNAPQRLPDIVNAASECQRPLAIPFAFVGVS